MPSDLPSCHIRIKKVCFVKIYVSKLGKISSDSNVFSLWLIFISHFNSHTSFLEADVWLHSFGICISLSTFAKKYNHFLLMGLQFCIERLLWDKIRHLFSLREDGLGVDVWWTQLNCAGFSVVYLEIILNIYI